MATREGLDLPIEFRDTIHKALVSVWWTGMLIGRVSRKFFGEHVSSEAQFNLLLVLWRADGPVPQSELGRKLLVDKSNITGLLDRLAKAGLVRRKRVAGDRRSYHVVLTEKGRGLIERLDADYEHKVREVMAGFSEEECADLVRLTRKVREGLLAATKAASVATGGAAAD